MARWGSVRGAVRRLPVTGRGTAVLVLGLALVAGAAASRWWVLLGLGAALLLLVGVEVLAVRADRALVVTRTVAPLVVQRGGTVRCVVEALLPPSRLPLRRAAVDHVDGEPRPVDLGVGAAGGAVGTGHDVAAIRRGVLLVGPLDVRTEGLLGLAVLRRTVGDPVQVRVLPRPAPVASLPRGSRRAATGQDERVETGGTDLVGLHEYVPGDDLRRLHWASSARTGSLMVRDDAEPALPHVLVLLDDRAPAWGPDAAAFEEGVDFAAGLVERALLEGRHVRLQCLSGRVDVEATARHATGAPDPRIRHALAEVDLVDGPHLGSVSSRDLDVGVLVTGVDADPAEAAGVLAACASPLVVQVDPAPVARFGSLGAVPAVRAATAYQLASSWEMAVR